MAFKVKVRNFCIDKDDDRQECESVLSKYTPLGMIRKHESFYDKNGIYYVALHWEEEMPEDEYRD
jgi:hypothetical protein